MRRPSAKQSLEISEILKRLDKPKPKRVRKKTKYEIFRGEYHQAQRHLGRSFNAIHISAHAEEVQAAYAQLPAERKALYELRAAVSLSASDARALLPVDPDQPALLDGAQEELGVEGVAMMKTWLSCRLARCRWIS